MFKKLSVLFLSGALLLCLAPIVQADFSAASKNVSNSALDSKYPKVQWDQSGTPNVYVIWVETDGTTDELYFSKSTDNGVTWSTPYQISFSGQILTQSDLTDDYTYSFVVADPYIHVVMQWRSSSSDDYDIWYKQSTDLGDTWDLWIALTSNDYESCFPDVDARGSYVHVVYQDDYPGNYEIIYKRLTNYGTGAVADQTRRLTTSSTDSYYPRIAVSETGYTVNIVYQDDYSGQWNIFTKYIPNDGAGAFSTRQLTFSNIYYNGRPNIAFGWGATYEEYVYIVYESDYGSGGLLQDIIYKRLDNWNKPTGTTSITARLTYSTTDSRSCHVDFDNLYNYVHICYHDDWPGNNDVMYRKMTNGGGGGFTGQRVSWGTGDSAHSTLDSHGAYAYVVWSDNSSGNYEILFKNGN